MNPIHRSSFLVLLALALVTVSGCSGERITEAVPPSQASLDVRPSSQSCWGQASAVFAQMGVMGQHASSYPTPRLGLRNLARSLYEAGVLQDDTMQALGAFVADELGLTIEACEREV
jgi:hypothetical protein